MRKELLFGTIPRTKKACDEKAELTISVWDRCSGFFNPPAARRFWRSPGVFWSVV